MDRTPVRLPLAAVTLCMPILLLLSRVGPGPLAASPDPASCAGSSCVPRRGVVAGPAPLATEEFNPRLSAPTLGKSEVEWADEPRVQVLQMPAITIIGSALNRGPTTARPDRRKAERSGGEDRLGTSDDRPRPARSLVGRINVNTASIGQMTLLPGLGPKRAAALVALRDRRPLRRPREVTKVRGIGSATWRRWKRYLAVEGETTLRSPADEPGIQAARMPSTARGDPR